MCQCYTREASKYFLNHISNYFLNLFLKYFLKYISKYFTTYFTKVFLVNLTQRGSLLLCQCYIQGQKKSIFLNCISKYFCNHIPKYFLKSISKYFSTYFAKVFLVNLTRRGSLLLCQCYFQEGLYSHKSSRCFHFLPKFIHSFKKAIFVLQKKSFIFIQIFFKLDLLFKSVLLGFHS